jgi:hypothetical protein
MSWVEMDPREEVNRVRQSAEVRSTVSQWTKAARPPNTEGC